MKEVSQLISGMDLHGTRRESCFEVWMKTCKFFAAFILVSAAGVATAHHSFAPHFDPDSLVTISGTIVEFEQRNPHAYLHIESDDGSGELREYTCESSGITQLRRNGIEPEFLQLGSRVTVTGQQHRRDPYKCFFRTVQVDGGPVLSIGGAGNPLEQSEAATVDSVASAQSGIFGNWLLIARGAGAGNGESYSGMLDYMTAAGRRAEASYDPIKDDPVYGCNPIGIRRVWFAPGTPTEVVLDNDRIVIRHEWMDVERIVYLNADDYRTDVPRRTFGHSIGRLENGVLTIETANYPAGVIRQYLEGSDGTSFKGLLHSAELATTEILRYDEQSQSLEVTMLFKDPGFYNRDFPPVTTRYERTELEIRPFGCIPEI